MWAAYQHQISMTFNNCIAILISFSSSVCCMHASRIMIHRKVKIGKWSSKRINIVKCYFKYKGFTKICNYWMYENIPLVLYVHLKQTYFPLKIPKLFDNWLENNVNVLCMFLGKKHRSKTSEQIFFILIISKT